MRPNITPILRISLNLFRTFQPSFDTVAKAWTKVTPADRNKHFFAYANFDNAMTVFQKVSNAAQRAKRKTEPL